jgi:transposase
MSRKRSNLSTIYVMLSIYTHTPNSSLHRRNIEETLKVQYTVSGLNKRLHQHQFSYKQPKGVPHKFDVDKQAAFIACYEQLKASLNETSHYY